MKVTTMRGREIDMSVMIAKNAEVAAIGNASMNARGDIIDNRGKIVKKREDVTMEYHRTASKTVTRVALKSIGDQVFDSPAAAVQAAEAQAKQAAVLNNLENAAKSTTKQRKMLDD